ncbi:hypothetical protein H4I96_04195 [Botrytis cinerea]
MVTRNLVLVERTQTFHRRVHSSRRIHTVLGSARSSTMLPTSHIHSLALRRTRQTFTKDLNFSIYWIFRANRIPFNECTCRQSAQLEFNPKDYAAGHEQQSVETCCSLFLMLQRAVVLDIEDMQLLIYKAMPWEWLERMIPYSCRRKEHPVSQNEITLISFLIPDYQSLSPSQNISSVLSLE